MFRQSALRRITVAAVAPTPLRVHVPRRLLFSRRNTRKSGRAVENLDIRRISEQAEEWQRNRRTFLWCGAIAGVVSFIYTAWKLKVELSKPVKLDASLPSSDP